MFKKLLCIILFHDPDYENVKRLDQNWNLFTCLRCGKKYRELTPEARAKIRHYCPLCHKLEQDCTCLAC